MKFYCQWLLVSENASKQFYTSRLLLGLGVGLCLSQCKHTIVVHLHWPTPRPTPKTDNNKMCTEPMEICIGSMQILRNIIIKSNSIRVDISLACGK